MIIRFFDKNTLACKGEFSRFTQTTQTQYINAVGTFSIVTDYLPENIGLEDIIFVSGTECEDYCGEITQINGNTAGGVPEYTFQGRELLGLLSERMPFSKTTELIAISSEKREDVILQILQAVFCADDARQVNQLVFSTSQSRGSQISYTCEPEKSVLDNVLSVAKVTNWGVCLTPDFANGKYVFNIIVPNETSVILSPKFDNLVNEQFTLSKAAHKNVAYYGISGDKNTTYGLADADSASGFARKERWISASENSTDAQIESVINMQLGNFKPVENFTGDYQSSKTFIFGEDFTLGDFVTYSGTAGTAKKQVIGFTQTHGAGQYTKQLLFGDNLTETVRAIQQINGGK